MVLAEQKAVRLGKGLAKNLVTLKLISLAAAVALFVGQAFVQVTPKYLFVIGVAILLESVSSVALGAIKAVGIKLPELLDFHYLVFWADAAIFFFVGLDYCWDAVQLAQGA